MFLGLYVILVDVGLFLPQAHQKRDLKRFWTFQTCLRPLFFMTLLISRWTFRVISGVQIGEKMYDVKSTCLDLPSPLKTGGNRGKSTLASQLPRRVWADYRACSVCQTMSRLTTYLGRPWTSSVKGLIWGSLAFPILFLGLRGRPAQKLKYFENLFEKLKENVMEWELKSEDCEKIFSHSLQSSIHPIF